MIERPEFAELQKYYPSLWNKNINSNWYTDLEREVHFKDYNFRIVTPGVYTKYEIEDVVYNTNNYGFRAKEFDNYTDIKLLLLGCSHTFGMGLPLEHTWGYQLADYLNIDHDYVCNLGISGADQTFVVNVLSAYAASDLPRPDYVAVMWPMSERISVLHNNLLEIILPTRNEVPTILEDRFDAYLNFFCVNDKWDDASYITHNITAKNIAASMGSKFADLRLTEKLRKSTIFGEEHLGRARDLMHGDDHINSIWCNMIKEKL